MRVASHAKVQRNARVLNHLPVEGDGICARGFLLGPPSITFTFRDGTGGPVLVKASGLDSVRDQVAYCSSTRFSTLGHKKLWLEGPGYLIKQAERIPGRRLH
jgi:hypothetical protein